MSLIFYNDPRIGPRWHGLAPLLEATPPSEREQVIDQFCKVYPTWFFEMKTELDGKPTVLDEYQIKYLLDDSRYKITNKTRQSGGSFMVAAAKFYKAFSTKNYRCDIVSVNRAEAQDKIKYIRNLYLSLPMRWRQGELWKDNLESIGFHGGSSGSEVKSVAASAGIRGGRKDVFFDEAAHIPFVEELFKAALPAISSNPSLQFEMVSTPNGMTGKFYELWSNEKDKYTHWSRHEFGWWNVARHCKDPVGAQERWVNDYKENPNFLYDLLEEFAVDHFKLDVASLTEEEYWQEFCAQFIDESESYFTFELIDKCRKASGEANRGEPDWIERWERRPDGNDNEVMIGIDFAEGRKGGDSTSIQVFEKDPKDNVYRQRYYRDLNYKQGYDSFDKQLHEIERIIRAFRPQTTRVDETGLGRKLAPDLKERVSDIVTVEGVTFTNVLKEEMVTNVKNMMEKERIHFQWEYKQLQMQFHNMKRKITAAGNIQYEGAPHDDIFWAVCLAVRGGSRMGFRIITL